MAKRSEKIMRKLKAIIAAFGVLSALIVPGMIGPYGSARAESTAEELNRDSDAAIEMLLRTNPIAATIAKRSRAVLVFPTIVKGGFIFGGAYGEGALKQGGRVVSYYNSFSASWGLQAGAQSYGYAVFLVNEGVAKNLSTTTLKDDAYAFIFDQKGLMAGVTIEGTKVSNTVR
jgi:lipid-binding SYLF domain-containing protein